MVYHAFIFVCRWNWNFCIFKSMDVINDVNQRISIVTRIDDIKSYECTSEHIFRRDSDWIDLESLFERLASDGQQHLFHCRSMPCHVLSSHRHLNCHMHYKFVHFSCIPSCCYCLLHFIFVYRKSIQRMLQDRICNEVALT